MICGKNCFSLVPLRVHFVFLMIYESLELYFKFIILFLQVFLVNANVTQRKVRERDMTYKN